VFAHPITDDCGFQSVILLMTKAVFDPFKEESGIHKKQTVARPVNRN
jgi:hypothetical protein